MVSSSYFCICTLLCVFLFSNICCKFGTMVVNVCAFKCCWRIVKENLPFYFFFLQFLFFLVKIFPFFLDVCFFFFFFKNSLCFCELVFYLFIYFLLNFGFFSFLWNDSCREWFVWNNFPCVHLCIIARNCSIENDQDVLAKINVVIKKWCA